MSAAVRGFVAGLAISPRSLAVGGLTAAGLLALYLGIISLAQGVDHAVQQLTTDAVFVTVIAVGFGIQIALFTELRTLDRRHRGAVAASAAGTGTSTVAMLACCAHHLADILPLVGVSAAAVFLDAYRTPLFLIGVAVNGVGVIVVARQLQRARRACVLIDGRPSAHLAVAG